MSEDVEMEGTSEKVEMIDDSGCTRTIVKPMAFKGMKITKIDDVGKASGQPMEHILPTNERRSLRGRTLQEKD